MSKRSNRLKARENKKLRTLIEETIKQAQHLPPSQQKGFSKWLKQSWKILTFLSVIVGLVGFAFLVYPRITVEPDRSPNYYEPFKNPFNITNVGYLPNYNIDYALIVTKLNSPILTITEGTHDHIDHVDKLEPYKPVTLSITSIEGIPINTADIYINVSFDLYFPRFRFSEWYHFSTELNSQNQFLWFSRPLQDSITNYYDKKLDDMRLYHKNLFEKK